MKNISLSVLITLSVVATLLLSGCTQSTGGLRKSVSIEGLPSANLPVVTVGDSAHFSNGRRLTVTAVDNHVISVHRSQFRSRKLTADFVLPDILSVNGSKRVTNELFDHEGSLWPIEVGRKAAFSVKRTSTDTVSNEKKISIRHWKCAVDSAEKMTVIAGKFDTYRINCQRFNSKMRFKQRRVWYYAPKIEHFVLRIDLSLYGKMRKLELVTFSPGLSGLSKKSTENYKAKFQDVIENTPSGEQVHWRSKHSSVEIKIRPEKSLKLGNGQYCRSYRLVLKRESLDRKGSGVVCRSREGEWKIPRRVTQEFRGNS